MNRLMMAPLLAILLLVIATIGLLPNQYVSFVENNKGIKDHKDNSKFNSVPTAKITIDNALLHN